MQNSRIGIYLSALFIALAISVAIIKLQSKEEKAPKTPDTSQRPAIKIDPLDIYRERFPDFLFSFADPDQTRLFVTHPENSHTAVITTEDLLKDDFDIESAFQPTTQKGDFTKKNTPQWLPLHPEVTFQKSAFSFKKKRTTHETLSGETDQLNITEVAEYYREKLLAADFILLSENHSEQQTILHFSHPMQQRNLSVTCTKKQATKVTLALVYSYLNQ